VLPNPLEKNLTNLDSKLRKFMDLLSDLDGKIPFLEFVV
jgi:hypothetical protein